MREQLIQYVELLFAGATDSEDIKQEILQNTLDRYDDLIAQGKVPEAAYRLAIAGIGDINEILGTDVPRTVISHPAADPDDGDSPTKKLLRAIAVGLYIICILPLIILDGDILGFCGTLSIVAVATVMILLGAKKDRKEIPNRDEETSRSPLQKAVSSAVWAVGLAGYMLWSFTSGAWYVTWVIFPILAALDGLLMVLVKQKEQQGTLSLPSPTVKPFRKRVKAWIWGFGIFLFVIVSLRTLAWGATWLFLPITAVAEQLVYAILDYMEVLEHET